MENDFVRNLRRQSVWQLDSKMEIIKSTTIDDLLPYPIRTVITAGTHGSVEHVYDIPMSEIRSVVCSLQSSSYIYEDDVLFDARTESLFRPTSFKVIRYAHRNIPVTPGYLTYGGMVTSILQLRGGVLSPVYRGYGSFADVSALEGGLDEDKVSGIISDNDSVRYFVPSITDIAPGTPITGSHADAMHVDDLDNPDAKRLITMLDAAGKESMDNMVSDALMLLEVIRSDSELDDSSRNVADSLFTFLESNRENADQRLVRAVECIAGYLGMRENK